MEYINVERYIISNNINSNDNYNRTNDTICNKLENSTRNLDINANYDKNNNNNLYIGIYRYKFTNYFTEELFKFSKIHQYDHRKDFKDAWENWMSENSDTVEEEVRRLINLGYDGDIIDKMYKSLDIYML